MTTANNEAQSGPPTRSLKISSSQVGSGSTMLIRLFNCATAMIVPSSVRTTGGQKVKRTGRRRSNSLNGTPAFSRMYSMIAQQTMMVSAANVAGVVEQPGDVLFDPARCAGWPTQHNESGPEQ